MLIGFLLFLFPPGEASNLSVWGFFYCPQKEVVVMAGRDTVIIDIDSSEVQAAVGRLRDVMTPEQFENAMHGIMKRMPGQVKIILGDTVPPKYHVNSTEVRKAVGYGKTSVGGGAGCVIPVRGERKHIGGGGRGFPGWGGAKGWESLKRKYRVSTKIYRGQLVRLPTHLVSYGGQPPFRNTAAPSLHGLTFTRLGKKRLPIEPVVGIAVPQMPPNKAEPATQDKIADKLLELTERRLMALVMNGR